MDINHISRYLNDKNKVRLIKISHDFYDKRFIINFFAMKLKNSDDTDITNFKCYIISSGKTVLKNMNLFKNITMLCIGTLKSYDLSCCENVTKMYIKNLECILPDEYIPPKLRKTVVNVARIDTSAKKNKFTATITKISLFISLKDDVDDNLFENYSYNKLQIYSMPKVKCLTKNITQLSMHDVKTEIDLDLFSDSSIEKMQLYVSGNFKMSLSKIFASLVELKVKSYRCVDTLNINNMSVGCLPNLKYIEMSMNIINENYAFLDDLELFCVTSASNAVLPKSKQIITKSIDMARCIIPDNVKALTFFSCASPDFSVLENLDFFETDAEFYFKHINDINLKKSCTLSLANIRVPKHDLSQISQEQIIMHSVTGKITDRRAILNDCVKHVVFLEEYMKVVEVFPDGLKLFASTHYVPNNLPAGIEELYLCIVTDPDIFKKFNNLKSFAYDGAKKSIKSHYKIENRQDVYDLLSKLYPNKYFKTYKYFY